MRARSRATWADLPGALALLAATAAGASGQSGSIAGVVRIEGSATANARAILDTTNQVRSDSLGRFQFHGIKPGRHRLIVLSIGARPYDVNVVVAANDTLRFDVDLVKAVLLDTVIVRGSTVREGFARAYEDRKRVGLGRYIDSAQVRNFAYVSQAVSYVPGVKYKEGTILFGVYECLPNLWIDNVNWGKDQGVLKTTAPQDVVGVEVYTRDLLIPEEFRPRGLDPGCGALVIWTKRFWPEARRP